MTTTLILPGLHDSGPEHWQSHGERVDPSCRRVVQADWETPLCADWAARGSRLVEIGPCGHVDSASGLGTWPTGHALLEALHAAPLLA